MLQLKCFGIYYFLFLASLEFIPLSVQGVAGIRCQKRLEVGVESGSLMLARNDVVFRDDVLFIKRLNFSFVNILWSETKLFIEDGS